MKRLLITLLPALLLGSILLSCGGDCCGETPLISTGRWVWEGEPESWTRPFDELQFQRGELNLFSPDSFQLLWSYSSKNPGKTCSGEEQRGRWDGGELFRLLLVTLEEREQCTPPQEWREIYLRETVRLKQVTEQQMLLCFAECDDEINWLTFQRSAP